MKTIKINLSLLMMITLFVCFESACKKKKKADETPIVEVPVGEIVDTAFTTLIKGADFLPTGNTIQSMTYDANTKNLFFYLKKTNNPNTGYSILQLNTVTKQALTVYSNTDPNWSNSNGSEGRRIRIAGNELYVMGGATNDAIHRLSGVSNNSLTLAASVPVTNDGGSPYDVAVKSNTMYIINMNSKVVYGNLTLSNAAAYTIGASSHGASITAVSNFLVCSGGGSSGGVIELRNLSNGAFIRSVTLPSSTRSTLERDVNNKIILVQADKIYRYSSDLLTKEEFKAKGASDDCQIALADEGDKTRIYQWENGEVQTMTIKN